MLIEHSKLIGLPVFELENQSKVAEISDFFIDTGEKKIEAAICKIGGIFHKTKFISAKEIIDVSKSAIVIQTDDSLVVPEEMIRLAKKFKTRAKIVGERVFSKNGNYLGVVNDYVIESGSLCILRIYVRKFLDERIIHSSAILKIEQHKITVKDDFEMVKPELAPMSAKTELA
ncbi:MAG: PRC-barrel domain-containing protein [Candidatus Berkelbacteria bacterium]|nr:PRC-barrel domain-containing protein [Candidatus Berkelbacteria bacterium]